MAILAIGGIALASVVVNTSGILADSRSTAQSRAAADAGLADAVASAVRLSDVCGDDDETEWLEGHLTGGSEYSVTRACDVPVVGQVTFRSVGTSKDGGSTVSEAVYQFERELAPVGDPSMTPTGLVLYEAAEMGQVNLFGTGDVTPQIVVPNGNFHCRLTVPGNVLVKGNITSTDSCHIGGDLWVGGTVGFDGGTTTVAGSVTAAGSGLSTIVASVGDPSKELASLRTGGPLNLKWNGGLVHANVIADGDVAVNDRIVEGSVRVPVGRTVSFGAGGQAKGGVLNVTVPSVPVPEMPGWFDYKFDSLDWPGYDVLTLRNSADSATDTCAYFNQHTGWNVGGTWVGGGNRGWTDLATRTNPVIVDGRACDSLTSNAGGNPSPALRTNVVFLAKQYNLTGLTMTAAAGADPSVWFITEDLVADEKPTCPVGSGSNFTVNGANLSGVRSTIYSPCVVSSNAGGSIRGSLYARGFASGSTLTINGELMGLPNQPEPDGTSGSSGGLPTGNEFLGHLVTQRDLRASEGGSP